MHDPISALSNVSRSRATSSAGKAFPGLNGFAIMGPTPVRSNVSSISKRAPGPDWRGGYGSAMPRAAYQASVTASRAKMPFCASASAIMLATVLRNGIGS